MSRDTYCLCFGFSNFSPKDLEKFHVTLIYFGELPLDEVSDVRAITEKFVSEDELYFIAGQLQTYLIEDKFGTNGDIRVLLPDPKSSTTKILIDDVNRLREQVEKYQKKKGFDFNPHLTTDLHSFSGRFDKLYLCASEYRIVESWSLI